MRKCWRCGRKEDHSTRLEEPFSNDALCKGCIGTMKRQISKLEKQMSERHLNPTEAKPEQPEQEYEPNPDPPHTPEEAGKLVIEKYGQEYAYRLIHSLADELSMRVELS